MTTVTTTKPEDEPPVTTSSPNTVVAGFGEMPNAMPPLPKPAQWKRCKASSKSIRTTNPIRAIVDPIVKSIQSGEERGDGKNHISLALGDPTATGTFPPCPAAIESLRKTLEASPHAAGYVDACGLPIARYAIAKYHSSPYHKVHPDQVIVANGCSGALELALTALLDTDRILLVPQPGFPLYQVIAESHGASIVHYKLKEHSNWECDLDHMESLIQEHGDKITGVLINNPSNPTGTVFSLHHLEEIVSFCQDHQLPIIADEVYGDLTFDGYTFHPLAQVAARLGKFVPVITASGIGKQFLLPGWRVGWIVFQDNIYNTLRDIEAGAKRLAQIILGASHLPQTVVSSLLDSNNTQVHIWKLGLRSVLQEQARFICSTLVRVPGLQVLTPGGAMYTLLRLVIHSFDETISNDVTFSETLLKEENVFVLPGTCFGVPNMIRIVFCAPIPVLEQATERIQAFCKRHSKKIQ